MCQCQRTSQLSIHLYAVGKSVVCIYVDDEGEHRLNGRLGLRSAAWRRRSKSVCAGLACCGLGWMAALSVTTAPLRAYVSGAMSEILPYNFCVACDGKSRLKAVNLDIRSRSSERLAVTVMGSKFLDQKYRKPVDRCDWGCGVDMTIATWRKCS